MTEIFVSYSSKDKPWVRMFVSALETLGREIWWDISLRTGARFARDIERQLDAARCVIVVWSAHSVASQWVEAEAMAAQQQGKLVPVRIDGSKLPLVFRPLQTLDLSGWSGDVSADVFRRLAADIATALGSPTCQPDVPSPVSHSAERVVPTQANRTTIDVADGLTLKSSKIGNVTGVKSEGAEELPDATHVSVLRRGRIVNSKVGDITGVEIKKRDSTQSE